MKYPHTMQIHDRVEYFDYTPDGAYLAVFERAYEGHLRMEVSTPFETWFGTVCVEGLKLDTAEDYKKLLDSLGYYQ
jgi:hypothetical protein